MCGSVTISHATQLSLYTLLLNRWKQFVLMSPTPSANDFTHEIGQADGSPEFGVLMSEVRIRGCPYITSAAITRQGHSECLRTLTLGSKGLFKSLCLMKIHMKGENQSNPHFVLHQKCEISIKIPLLRAKKCQTSTSSPNLWIWIWIFL